MMGDLTKENHIGKSAYIALGAVAAGLFLIGAVLVVSSHRRP